LQPISKNCTECGNSYETASQCANKSMFCGLNCKMRAFRRKHQGQPANAQPKGPVTTAQCQQCSNPFIATVAACKRGTKAPKYCTPKCSDAANRKRKAARTR
jgi:hypothetical protein